MRKIIFLLLYCFSITILTSCSSAHNLIKPSAHSKKARVLGVFPAYSGLKSRIAVADFDVKANKATFETGSGLRQIFIGALLRSGRFDIVERQPQADAQKGNESKKDAKAADLIITATVTGFEPQVSGGRAGAGGGGGAGNGMMGGLLSPSLNNANMALEIRIVDNSTSEVILSHSVYGQVSDAKAATMADFLEKIDLANGLSVYVNTPMEKAICTCIIEAVRHISQNVPARYYKY